LNNYELICKELESHPKTWLITGVAGFIGSNILEELLNLDQKVVGLDNFQTGSNSNLQEVKSEVSKNQWSNFTFLEGDIRKLDDCKKACADVDVVLHQAALGSVPRSIEDPITTNNININGFLNMILASKDSDVDSFVYASSSSVYGDHPDLPKVEDKIGKQLSPYAFSKYSNEVYAEIFYKCYNFKSIGLRYFNVFGKRQDPRGPYAAVIPKWISSMIKEEEVIIHGDGETTRDFCFVENAVQANLLSALVIKEQLNTEVFNVALNHRTSLNQLFSILKNSLQGEGIIYSKDAIYTDFRSGDIRHSQADISKAIKFLGYNPKYDVTSGLKKSIKWYIQNG